MAGLLDKDTVQILPMRCPVSVFSLSLSFVCVFVARLPPPWSHSSSSNRSSNSSSLCFSSHPDTNHPNPSANWALFLYFYALLPGLCVSLLFDRWSVCVCSCASWQRRKGRKERKGIRLCFVRERTDETIIGIFSRFDQRATSNEQRATSERVSSDAHETMSV
jgi:hypothetical protein